MQMHQKSSTHKLLSRFVNKYIYILQNELKITIYISRPTRDKINTILSQKNFDCLCSPDSAV